MMCFAIGWILCGILGYGIDFAYFQGKYPDKNMEREDMGQAMLMSFGGPIFLVAVFFYTGFAKYGLRFK